MFFDEITGTLKTDHNLSLKSTIAIELFTFLIF